MREIKFRAWNKITRRMWEPFSFTHNGQYYWVCTETFEYMQYTGLKDKNGVEIYEGDVIEVERDGETWGATPTIVRYEVKFADGAFYTHHKFTINKNKLPILLPILADWGEVIGNIYENPELLTNITSDK